MTGKSSHGPDDSEDKENNTKEIEPKMSHSEGLTAVESTFEQYDASATWTFCFFAGYVLRQRNVGLSVKPKKILYLSSET